jgi:hypothetical protein
LPSPGAATADVLHNLDRQDVYGFRRLDGYLPACDRIHVLEVQRRGSGVSSDYKLLRAGRFGFKGALMAIALLLRYTVLALRACTKMTAVLSTTAGGRQRRLKLRRSARR